jgi:hypothetical protein
VALSYDELAAQYRASLRREVQLKARCDEFERRLLVESGRLRNAAQLIVEDLAQLKREQRMQEAGHEMDRIAHQARPAIALER